MRLDFRRFRSLLPADREEPETRYFKIAILSLVGIVLLTTASAATTFLLSLRGAEETVVPELVSMELPEALLDLQDRELYPRVQLRYFSDPSLKGRVVEQSPAPGTQVRAGRRINLVVSRGAIVDQVGNYIGRNLNEVEEELQTLFATFDALLQIENVSYVFDEAPPGTILQQDPLPDTPLTDVTDLDLVVSRGPGAERVSLSGYVSLGYAEALSRLRQRGRPFVVTLTSGSQPGTVIAQSPPPGTQVSTSAKVFLTLVPPETQEGEVFGLFRRVLPDYPVAVDLALDFVDPEGNRIRIFEMRHPGGEIAVPYLVPEGSTLILSRNGTDVVTEPATQA